jgi:hypothetical protein
VTSLISRYQNMNENKLGAWHASSAPV